eukprot:11223099-Lingulodinium_polyedra.AAC.1
MSCARPSRGTYARARQRAAWARAMGGIRCNAMQCANGRARAAATRHPQETMTPHAPHKIVANL